ncbi:hypothetical protein [Methylocucumis oryzae]|uniref:hypothetical protein n=1 Tax=Methylocucumis oryzae TaxID=1632867 RepID=UPI0006977B6C|nr:hypothetical protein [Methylocucumis oryzae]
MLSRSIKKIYSTDDINKQDNLTFADILAIPNIVLLGEPGAGKTHLFKIASAYEQGNCIAAGDFTVYADESYSDKALYIDALDEMRSRTDQHNSIKAIIGSIKKSQTIKSSYILPCYRLAR